MDIEPPPANGSTFETYHRFRAISEAVVALGVGIALAYAFVRWRPFGVEIAGPSMAPTLQPGDWALATAPGRVRRWDIVVIEHPSRPGFEMVKRIVGVPNEPGPGGTELGADEWWVEGDAPGESTDSRHFGPVRTDDIKAKIRMVYWPPPRRRLL